MMMIHDGDDDQTSTLAAGGSFCQWEYPLKIYWSILPFPQFLA